jgi:nucleoside-diphosphate-sugar epimerase
LPPPSDGKWEKARSAVLIAVTGATGFLGRYIVRHLAGAGHRLRCWFRRTPYDSGLADVARSIGWVRGDLLDPASSAALVQGVDAVVHAALDDDLKRGPQAAQRNLDRFLQANLMGSLRIFQDAFAAGVPRFVFISTCAVHDVILNDRPLDEAHPLWPTGHYGAHKAALEKFVHSYGLGHGWPICALRPTGIYGLAHPPSASRWFELVGRVLRGEPISSAEGGKEVHAADVAGAVGLLLAADADRVRGQAFNCYDCYIAEQEVARIARELSGSPSSIADLNRGPRNQIDTRKILALGMEFGGEPLLRRTVSELLEAHRAGTPRRAGSSRP